MCSLDISSFIIQMVLPILGFCPHGGCECFFFPHTVPCKSLLIGQEEKKVFALPSTPHTGCVSCQCHRFVFLSRRWLWLGAVWSWQPEPCQPSRTQGTAWLILSLSVSQQGLVPTPCPGTLVTQLRQELLALLIERGCLICRLYSSDS